MAGNFVLFLIGLAVSWALIGGMRCYANREKEEKIPDPGSEGNMARPGSEGEEADTGIQEEEADTGNIYVAGKQSDRKKAVIFTLLVMAFYFLWFVVSYYLEAWPVVSLVQVIALPVIWWGTGKIAGMVPAAEKDAAQGNCFAFLGLVLAGVIAFAGSGDSRIFIQLLGMAIAIYLGGFITAETLFKGVPLKRVFATVGENFKKNFSVPDPKHAIQYFAIVAVIDFLILLLFRFVGGFRPIIIGFVIGALVILFIIYQVNKKENGEETEEEAENVSENENAPEVE